MTEGLEEESWIEESLSAVNIILIVEQRGRPSTCHSWVIRILHQQGDTLSTCTSCSEVPFDISTDDGSFTSLTIQGPDQRGSSFPAVV